MGSFKFESTRTVQVPQRPTGVSPLNHACVNKLHIHHANPEGRRFRHLVNTCPDAFTGTRAVDQSKFPLAQQSCVIMGTHQQDVARVTNEQKSRWDDSARSYSEVLIRKGAPEPNTRQVIAAVQLHTKDKTGARTGALM